MNLTEDDPLNEFHLEQIKHTHFIISEGRKITMENGYDWFSYINCSCGLTGVNENGKIEWNEHNFCQRLEKTVYKN